MINITLICIGTLKEKYLKDALAEYKKRLTTLCKLTLVELSEERLPERASQNEIFAALEKEADKIISKIPKGAKTIPLVIEGTQLSSEHLSEMIGNYGVNGVSNIVFIIGSSYGLAEKIKQSGDFLLSMSKMTFPHQLARVMLCEQIYRAFQIQTHSKYHK